MHVLEVVGWVASLSLPGLAVILAGRWVGVQILSVPLGVLIAWKHTPVRHAPDLLAHRSTLVRRPRLVATRRRIARIGVPVAPGCLGLTVRVTMLAGILFVGLLLLRTPGRDRLAAIRVVVAF